jgi:S-adenosylmethionine:diacylglycerol 3-amino-3-carboxypropyl transferase
LEEKIITVFFISSNTKFEEHTGINLWKNSFNNIRTFSSKLKTNNKNQLPTLMGASNYELISWTIQRCIDLVIADFISIQTEYLKMIG